jgi:hypothetical protein
MKEIEIYAERYARVYSLVCCLLCAWSWCETCIWKADVQVVCI